MNTLFASSFSLNEIEVIRMSQPSNRSAADRRAFLKKASAALVVIPATTSVAEEETLDISSKFQPESFWKDRMQDPEPDKRLGWFVDTRRCFGCHGCEVSCKAENDVPLGNYIRQTFYQDVGEYPKVARMFLPMSCQHCEDAPEHFTRNQEAPSR